MMTSSSFHDCHHPDEYVDAAIFIYPEPRENQLELPSPSDALRFALVPLRHLRIMGGDNQVAVVPSKALLETNIINLNDYHLPDEYCDAAALFSYDHKNDGDDEAPAPHDIFSSFLSWLRYTHNDNDTPSQSLEPSLTSDMNISNCHLPEDYIDSTVVCDSSPTIVANDDVTSSSSSTGDLFDSIAAFLTRVNEGSDDTDEEESVCDESSNNNISMDDCDLPDEFVDAVISCNNTKSEPAEPTPLDRLNEKIRQVLSPSKQTFNSSIQTDDDKTQKDTSSLDNGTFNDVSPQRRVVWEKTKSEVSIGSLDSKVPKASSPRVRVLLRKRTPSKTKVCNDS